MTDQRIMQAIRNLAACDVSGWFVLIVDDEPDNRSIASKVLTYSGAKVYTAANGAEGLVGLEQFVPSFILLDLSMPVMDGWEMCRKVRANPKTQHIPIIALTAHAMAGERDKALAAGCNDYDTKPVDFVRLLGKIESLLPA